MSKPTTAAAAQPRLFDLADTTIADLGTIAGRWSKDMTLARAAFVARMWPAHPRRAQLVTFVLIAMGGRGWCDETSTQLGRAMAMTAATVRSHLRTAYAEGVLEFTGRTTSRRIAPGLILREALASAQLVQSGVHKPALLVQSGVHTPQTRLRDSSDLCATDGCPNARAPDGSGGWYPRCGPCGIAYQRHSQQQTAPARPAQYQSPICVSCGEAIVQGLCVCHP